MTSPTLKFACITSLGLVVATSAFTSACEGDASSPGDDSGGSSAGSRSDEASGNGERNGGGGGADNGANGGEGQVDGDPTCETGIESGDACCAAECGECGGIGCDTRPGGEDACCTSNILEADVSCSGNEPPCVIPSPEPSGGGSQAGNISSLLVGNNVWYQPGEAVWNAVAPAGLKIVRIGGHQYDDNMPSNAQLEEWVNEIKALGAEPMIQVSQYESAEEAAAVVTYFNVTTNNPVKYWNIGNEPWLQADRPPMGEVADDVEAYVKSHASAMKGVDPTIKIFAPDACEYFDELYNALLGGDNDISGQDAEGNYYIDGISWHRYADTPNLAGDMHSRIAKTRTRIDYANDLHGRTGDSALQFGIGEFNSNAGGGQTCSFENGQAIARSYGSLMEYGGTYAALWSFREGGSSCDGTDFGFLDGDYNPRSSFYHMQMVSQNFYGDYADGTDNQGDLYTFGAVSDGYIAVMLINEGGTLDCNVRLNGDAVDGACQVNIEADVAVTHAQSVGENTTMVLVFDGAGALQTRITYAEGGTPQTENL